MYGHGSNEHGTLQFSTKFQNMFETRNNLQMYELIPDLSEKYSYGNQKKSHTLPHINKGSLPDFRYHRSTGNLNESSPKSTHNKFKFFRNDLLSGYDSQKCQRGGSKLTSTNKKSLPNSIPVYTNWQTDRKGLNYLHGHNPSGRHHCDREMYAMVQAKRLQCKFHINEFESIPQKWLQNISGASTAPQTLCEGDHLKHRNSTKVGKNTADIRKLLHKIA